MGWAPEDSANFSAHVQFCAAQGQVELFSNFVPPARRGRHKASDARFSAQVQCCATQLLAEGSSPRSHLRGAGGAQAPRLSPPEGSLRPESGVESGRHQREAVEFRPPRTSSSSRSCGGRVYSAEAVVQALRRLGWQGCARANDLATSSRRRMRAAPSRLGCAETPRLAAIPSLTLSRRRMPAAPSRSGCAETPRLAAIPSHGSPNKACICPRAARPPLPPHCASAPPCCPGVGSPSPADSRAPSTSSQASTSVFSSNWSCSTTIRFEERAGRGVCAFAPS